MPYPPDHKAETRSRILDSARRLFNRQGLSEPSIDEIMAGAGMTRGGFYHHFGSKEELYAEAILHFVHCQPVPGWQQSGAPPSGGDDMARGMLRAYLSREHADDLEGSCPMIGLASDVARGGALAKSAYRQVLAMMAGIFAGTLGPDPLAPAVEARANSTTEAEDRALAMVALCVGGMVLARAVDDSDTADRVRAAAQRAAAGIAGWTDVQTV